MITQHLLIKLNQFLSQFNFQIFVIVISLIHKNFAFQVSILTQMELIEYYL